MERSVWTDERIDDMVAEVYRRFDQVDARFDQVDARFDRLEARLDRLEARLDRLEARIDGLYRQMLTFAGAQFVGLLVILVTLVART